MTMEQHPRVEPVKTPETPRPSGKLMWHIAHGKFEGGAFKPDEPPVKKVSEKSYQALEAQHDHAREEDSRKRQAEVKAFMRAKNIPDETTNLHHAEMLFWAEKEARTIAKMVRTKNPDTIAALKKLGFTIDGIADADLERAIQKALYTETSSTSGDYGKFYRDYCARTAKTNELLVAKLEAKEMDDIQVFLTDILGGKQAFKALKALRQTNDMVAETQADPAKQTEVYKAKPDLNTTTGEQETLNFFKAGDDMAKKKRDAAAHQAQERQATQPQSPSESPATRNQALSDALRASPTTRASYQQPERPELHLTVRSVAQIEEKRTPELTVRVATAQESTKNTPQTNEDSTFIDLNNLAGGVFDGAGGEGGQGAPRRASQDGAKAFAKVMGEAGIVTTKQQAEDLIRRGIEAAHAAVIGVPDKGMTTATVFKVWVGSDGKRQVTIGNVGDSRASIIKKDGTIVPLTRDHNLLRQRFEQGLISESDYKRADKIFDSFDQIDVNDPRLNETIELKNAAGVSVPKTLRQLYDNIHISRGLGSSNHTPDVQTFSLEEGDMIFLHSDGVQDNLSNPLQEFLIKDRTNRSPEQIAATIVDAAIQNSQVNYQKILRAKKDDITAMVISFKQNGQPNVSPTHSPTPETLHNGITLSAEQQRRVDQARQDIFERAGKRSAEEHLQLITDVTGDSSHGILKETEQGNGKLKKTIQETAAAPEGKQFIRDGAVAYIPSIPGEKVITIGDIHGDPTTIQRILTQEGFIENMESGRQSLRLVFLGDMVDRGPKSVEVMEIFMVLKKRYGDRVQMIAADHDTIQNTVSSHDFPDQLKKHFHSSAIGADVYGSYDKLFQALPKMVITGDGAVMVHGGFPPIKNADLTKIARLDKSPVYGETMSWGDPLDQPVPLEEQYKMVMRKVAYQRVMDWVNTSGFSEDQWINLSNLTDIWAKTLGISDTLEKNYPSIDEKCSIKVKDLRVATEVLNNLPPGVVLNMSRAGSPFPVDAIVAGLFAYDQNAFDTFMTSIGGKVMVRGHQTSDDVSGGPSMFGDRLQTIHSTGGNSTSGSPDSAYKFRETKPKYAVITLGKQQPTWQAGDVKEVWATTPKPAAQGPIRTAGPMPYAPAKPTAKPAQPIRVIRQAWPGAPKTPTPVVRRWAPANTGSSPSYEATRSSITPQEITALAEQAGQYIRQKQRQSVNVPPGQIVLPPTGRDALIGAVTGISSRDGEHFQAHGIAKGGNRDQLQALVNLLSGQPLIGSSTITNLDPNTMLPVYATGGFILIGGKDQNMLLDDGRVLPKMIAVNEQFYQAIPTLQRWFPRVQFVKADELTQTIQHEMSRNN